MPTGRPDYWYGTALYFEDTPSDGEMSRGPTSNWAFDHGADVDIHHSSPEETDVLYLGKNIGVAGARRIDFFPVGSTVRYGFMGRETGANGVIKVYNNGTGAFVTHLDGADRFRVLAAGGVELCWDDTPTNGMITKGLTSDWGYDHVNNAVAHGAQYDPEKVDTIAVNKTSGTPASSGFQIHANGDATVYAKIWRSTVYASLLYIDQYGGEDIVFRFGGTERFRIEAAGGLTGCWDDTPTNGLVTKGVTSDWAFEHAADGDIHGGIGYVDRGAGAEDFDLTDMDQTNSWTDLDCSAVVPAGAKAIHFHVRIDYPSANQLFYLRENGYGGADNALILASQVAAVLSMADGIVTCDVNRIVEYYAPANANSLGVRIRGWFL